MDTIKKYVSRTFILSLSYTNSIFRPPVSGFWNSSHFNQRQQVQSILDSLPYRNHLKVKVNFKHTVVECIRPHYIFRWFSSSTLYIIGSISVVQFPDMTFSQRRRRAWAEEESLYWSALLHFGHVFGKNVGGSWVQRSWNYVPRASSIQDGNKTKEKITAR